MVETIESVEYIMEHRKKVLDAANKIAEYINTCYGMYPEVREKMKEFVNRAYNHDDDKIDCIDTLTLYNMKDNNEADDNDREEYKKLHKESNRHHVEYFQKNNCDMEYLDILEFICDNYSSTVLRNKKIDEEVLWEQRNAGFSDEYLYMILNTFAMLNFNFKKQLLENPKYRGKGIYNLRNFTRQELLNKNHKRFINK